MSDKSKKEKTHRKGWPEAIIFLLMIHTMPYLPLWLIRLIAVGLFCLIYPIAGIIGGLKRRFVKNIDVAYQGSLTNKELRVIARKSLYIQLVGIMEAIHYYHPRNKEELKEKVRIDGIENVVNAKKNGMGAIGVTAHLGNFQLLAVRLNVERQLNFWFLSRDPKTKALADAWYRKMEKADLKKINFTERSKAAKGVIRELKNSGFIMMVADEYKRNGVKVDFFGRPTFMAAGPAVISMRTGAPLLPMFIIRGKRSRYHLVIEEPIEHILTGDTERDVQALTQKRTDILEKYVKQYPDQWLWLHSRWRGEKQKAK